MLKATSKEPLFGRELLVHFIRLSEFDVKKSKSSCIDKIQLVKCSGKMKGFQWALIYSVFL
ncbi:hypothetical protein BI198_07875 [Rheinheimera salexigens]|uniref:Uncharacterized protein n=1 Tax=Rheinheimera salexigens TaxID=1628148 RepID=A0A1E7Q5Z5_9GAMM|nr:hypothetical protein BI198_07875 [Rheinheimera salexigens]